MNGRITAVRGASADNHTDTADGAGRSVSKSTAPQRGHAVLNSLTAVCGSTPPATIARGTALVQITRTADNRARACRDRPVIPWDGREGFHKPSHLRRHDSTQAWLKPTRARPDNGWCHAFIVAKRSAAPSVPAAAPKAGLTVSKVVAGAGAAATSAVAGSVFGADGTVVGAAVGSVVSAVAAVAYERSLDRTRQVVVSRVRLPNGRTTEVTQVLPADVTQVIPAQRPAAGARPATPVAPARPPRSTRLPLLAGGTALIFLVGLLAVTGVELLAGGPVLSSHQGGTSVGRVLGDGTGSGSPATTTDSPAATTTSSPTGTDSSATPTTVGQANPAAPASGSAAADSAAAPQTRSARSSDTAAPTTSSSSPSGAG